MAGSVSKQERLMALLSELLNAERPLTAEELWDRVPGYDPSANLAALRRAFERDKDFLRSRGVPIETAEALGFDPPRDGYRIDPKRYYMELPALAADELAALRLACELIDVGADSLDRALWRLGGVVTDDDGTVLASLGPAAVAPSAQAAVPVAEGVEELLGAIGARAPIEVLYNDKLRVLHPYRLDVKWGRWYLAAHDTTHDEVRRFRVDRLAPLPETGELVRQLAGTFTRPDTPIGPPPDVWSFGEGEPVTARLRVDASQVARLRFEVEDGATVELAEDGSAIFTFEVRNREGFRWLALGLLEHGEILSPPELREDLVTWLEALS